MQRIEFSRKTFIKNMFLRTYDDFEMKSLEFPPYTISLNMLNISSVADFAFKICRMNVQVLLACLSNNNKIAHKQRFYEMRKQITSLLHMMRSGKNTFLNQMESRLSLFRTFLTRFFTEKFIKLFFMATHSRGNEVSFNVVRGNFERTQNHYRWISQATICSMAC